MILSGKSATFRDHAPCDAANSRARCAAGEAVPGCGLRSNRASHCGQAPSSIRGHMRAKYHSDKKQQGGPSMPTQSQAFRAAAFLLGALIATPTFAQTCTGPLRKINVGVAVAPP